MVGTFPGVYGSVELNMQLYSENMLQRLHKKICSQIALVNESELNKIKCKLNREMRSNFTFNIHVFLHEQTFQDLERFENPLEHQLRRKAHSFKFC